MPSHQPRQSVPPPAQQAHGAFHVSDGSAEVLLIEQLAVRLQMSVRTIRRRMRAGSFPIPTLPRLDHRHRWSSVVVNEWVSRMEHQPRLVRRRA